MKNLIPTISVTPSTKTNGEVISKMTLVNIKSVSDAKVFLTETAKDFNEYELTLKQFLLKLDDYTDKIIEITREPKL